MAMDKTPSKVPADVLAEEELAARLERQRDASAHAAVPKPSLLLTFLSAGMANSISAASTNWADCIKVRQQLEMNRQRRPFWQVASSMVRTEGARSLLNGVTASCLRESTYSTIRMGAYESFKELYAPIVSESSFGNKLLAGASSGALGAAISTPTDLIKVRFQAPRPNGRPPYRNVLVAFPEIYRESGGSSSSFLRGIRNLYRGTYANVMRATVLTSTQIGSYDEIKGQIRRAFPSIQEGFLLHFYSSTVAGLVCSLASQPVDVIKVRVMQDRTVNALQAIQSLLRTEGVGALYKGFGMCWARLGTHTVISLILFENFRSLFGIKPL